MNMVGLIVSSFQNVCPADKFIIIKNKSKDPVVPTPPHDGFDYEKEEWKGGSNSLGRTAGY